MMARSVLAAIGLGANLADPARQIRRALSALALTPKSTILSCSSLYANPPMGPQDQPDYVNAVAVLQTALRPVSLLGELQCIEYRQGRRRGGSRWGARCLDLDLLLYGDAVINSARLTVPHPGIADRSFVVLPLLEVMPDAVIPNQGSVAELAAKCDQSLLVRLDG